MVAHHQVLLAGSPLPGLRGVRMAGGRIEVAPPTILRLLREDFIPHLLAELATADGRGRLQGEVVGAVPGEPLRLEQPVHRAFNLLLLEASCRVPGLPRLDPARVHSAGLVVRRRIGHGPLEGWMREGGRVVGWRPLPAEALDPTAGWDPEPARRIERRRGVNGRLLARLPLPPDPLDGLEETASGLFPAGPELAQATGRTLLYGYLPVASSERGDEAPQPPFARADIASRIPLLLRPDRDPALLPPAAEVLAVAAGRPPELPDQGGMRTLFDAVSYLAQEAGLFTGEAYAGPLANALAAIPVEGVPERLGDYLAYLDYAHARLFERRDPDAEAGIDELPSHLMFGPSAWPAIDAGTFEALVDAVQAAVQARFARLASPEGRFEAEGARYEAFAFIRIEHPGCPPRAVWSTASAPFTIKPWHESGEAPPTTVELPAPTRDNLRRLRPNIAFKVPPELQELMDRLNMQGLLDGKAERRSGISFGMICSFSIPILTLCAFIVLQLFLVLMHILFFWLPFVRICIPVPKPPEGEDGT